MPSIHNPAKTRLKKISEMFPTSESSNMGLMIGPGPFSSYTKSIALGGV